MYCSAFPNTHAVTFTPRHNRTIGQHCLTQQKQVNRLTLPVFLIDKSIRELTKITSHTAYSLWRVETDYGKLSFCKPISYFKVFIFINLYIFLAIKALSFCKTQIFFLLNIQLLIINVIQQNVFHWKGNPKDFEWIYHLTILNSYLNCEVKKDRYITN